MSIRTKSQTAAIDAARVAAQLRGEVKFIPPYPCKRGHALRYVATLHCVDCAPFHKSKKLERAHAQRIRRVVQRAESW